MEDFKTMQQKRITGYIFWLTVVPQLIMLALVAIATYFIYYGFDADESILLSVLGILGGIATLATMFSVCLFVKMYGVPFFSKKNNNDYSYQASTKTEYKLVLGEKDARTGKRSATIEEEKKSDGGGLIIDILIESFTIGVFGIFKFLIEMMRIRSSESRLTAWESVRLVIKTKIAGSKSIISFFKFPIISFILCAILLVLFIIIQMLNY